MLSQNWRSAYERLIQNVRQQLYINNLDGAVYKQMNGSKSYLPAYIPYVGRDYFQFRPRILCYAINQNLSPHVPWSSEWTSRWFADKDEALDRLNLAMRRGEPLPIRPYAEGFIPLVALLALSSCRKMPEGDSLTGVIDNVVAVTNFVKFSTQADASSSSIPNMWWRECGLKYVHFEIKVLRPDIILAFGQKTMLELKRLLKNFEDSAPHPLLLACRFPARMPSIKSRPLSMKEMIVWNNQIAPLIEKMRRPRDDSYHRWKIEKYPGYFIDVQNSWKLDFDVQLGKSK